MKKEEIIGIVNNFNQSPPVGGVSLELVDFDDKNLKLKFNCSDKTEFKVQGKIVTMADESKKFVEKYLKNKIKNINIILL